MLVLVEHAHRATRSAHHHPSPSRSSPQCYCRLVGFARAQQPAPGRWQTGGAGDKEGSLRCTLLLHAAIPRLKAAMESSFVVRSSGAQRHAGRRRGGVCHPYP
jgi:hypothetical protein